jgi:anthranilate synthase/aminodeoxychorismate synthase-like glutamine amidotransferase
MADYMNVLVLDNYDSFTWNIVEILAKLGARCDVHRSDRIGLEQIAAFQPDRIVLSPGPFGPDRAGVCSEAVRTFSRKVPVLGVCLGMQVIAEMAGATVRASGHPVHGKASPVFHTGKGIFAGVPSPFLAARYHSLHIMPDSVPGELGITAWTGDGVVMGCRMKDRNVDGVLFHPESFLTEHGLLLFENFLRD